MPISDRIEGSVEKWSDKWKDRLRGWMVSWLSLGIEAFADAIAKKASEQLSPTIAQLEQAGIPPALKPIIDEIKKPTGEIAALSGMGFLNRVVGSIKGDIFEYFTRELTRAFSYSANFYLPDPQLLLDYWLRNIIYNKEDLYNLMRYHGIPPEETDKLLKAKELRFPSEVVSLLALRDKAKYSKYWADVKALGVDQERLEALQELAYKIPGVQDIIRYVVREAYSPEIYKAFGQDQEYPGIAEADAEKAGVRPDHLMKEWIAHWDLPSVGNGFEMLHRGEITQEELSLLLKARDIMPFWRDKLTAISWTIPTRIEVRMMAQLGLVDKAFIMDILAKDGLAEEYRSVVADMNIVRGIRADLQTRYTKKWLDSSGVKAEIEKSGLSPDIGERLYQWIVSNTKPDRTVTERNLTTAEIVKGVKKGIIDWSDGSDRLVALGYDEDEAAFILAVNIEAVQEEPTSTITVQTDTIRRQRRQRLISKEDELSALIAIGLESALALAYADNDDLRLIKAPAEGT